jgi:uncharacterized protein YbaP (TraB family)
MTPRRIFRAVLAACALAVALPCPDAGAAGAESRFSHGLLWRVSRDGAPPSYVFGTIHVPDPRVLEPPEAVSRALARSRRLYTETYLGPREEARFFEAAQFEDGRRLEPLIGSETYARVAAELRARNVPDEVIARIKPWAALANLTVMPDDYASATLDQKLAAMARGRGMRVLGLEGIEEQIAVFDRIPLDTQIELLKHALGHRDELAAMIEPTIQAWMRRDLAGLQSVSARIGARYPEMAAHYRVLFTSVVHNRTIVMAYRLFMPLREGRAFVAVGANHLYGDQGLLALIEQQGYRVTRVY